MKRRLLAFAAVLLAGRAAFAQPTRIDDGFEAALAEGRRFYEIREWDKAIAKFKEAYTIREDPRALFNIAQAYRLKGDCASAASVYKTFKRKFPRDENIERVDKFIASMEVCAEAAAARQPTVDHPGAGGRAMADPPGGPGSSEASEASGADLSKAADPGASAPPSRVPSYLMIGGLTLAAGGLATHLLLLKPVRDDLADAARAHDEPEYRRLESRFDTRRTLAIGLYAAGGLAVGTGLVLKFTIFKREEAPAQVSFVPQPGGGVVSFSASL